MASSDEVIEKGEIEATKENEKDKEEDGDENKENCNTCKNDQEVVFIQDLGFTVKVAAPGVEPFDIQVSSMELVQGSTSC